jgi:hypothetical protein
MWPLVLRKKYYLRLGLTILQLVNKDTPCTVAGWFIIKPKIPNLGKFWRALHWKMLMCLMDIWNILRTFGVFYGHLEYFTDISENFDNLVVFCVHLAHLFRFWYRATRKIWQPWLLVEVETYTTCYTAH